jgi:glycogen debranching enzyme
VPLEAAASTARARGAPRGGTDPWGNIDRLAVGSSRLTLVEGDTFLISDAAGDIAQGTADGFYHRDTRFLDELQLLVDGRPPERLSSAAVDPFSARIFLRPAGWPDDDAPVIEVRRFVGDGLHQDLLVSNSGGEPLDLTLELRLGADFADMFEVKRAARRRRRRIQVEVDEAASTVTFRSVRRRRRRSTLVQAMPEANPVVEARRIVYRPRVPPRTTWRTCLDVIPVHGDERFEPRCRCDAFGLIANPMADRSRRWLAQFPRLETDDDDLRHLFERSCRDLGALRIPSPDGSDRVVVAAGMPWFMTLFGRDALLTAYMALPFAPGLAVDSLEVLAAFQGRRPDPRTDEEPGKILHEIRSGPLATAWAGPRGVYYGSIDATLLFVILAAEVQRWGVAPRAIERLLPSIERAVDWALTWGDLDGDGYVEYSRRAGRGLVNQGWKDSSDAIQFADGRLARGPIALIEVQGYLIDALRSAADLFEALGRRDRVAACRARAAALSGRLASDFFVARSPAGEQYLGLGLDGEKRVIDALASNMGHLLWSRAVDEPTAAGIAAHLTSPTLFSGWGIRTLATTNAGYAPVSYHRGSVWPHDTALIVHGLTRYGQVEAAAMVSRGLLRAAPSFDYRLPELFSGLPDDGHGFPVAYPTSSRPQAWAAASPLLLIRAWLGLEADLPNGILWLRPAVPSGIERIVLRGLRLGPWRFDVRWRSGALDIEGLPGSIRVLSPGSDGRSNGVGAPPSEPGSTAGTGTQPAPEGRDEAQRG